MPIIEFSDFTFQYYSQAEPTLHDINLKIYPGEKILIVGPSGSGKSTLGHCLNGLIPFSYRGEIQGSLKIKGQETKAQDIFKLSKEIGTVLQDSDAQFVGLTVGEDIAFTLENDNVSTPEMHKRVEDVALMVDMETLLNSSPFELSGGQKQRVAIARALAMDPKILLLDEPTSALDPTLIGEVISVIKGLADKGMTMIMATHQISLINNIASDILFMKKGRIVEQGPPSMLLGYGNDSRSQGFCDTLNDLSAMEG